MDVVMIVLAGLVIMPFIVGWWKCHEMTIAIELNKMNSPFYKMGIFSERFHLSDDQVEDELTIGLFFVNIVFVFWRDNSIEDFNA